MLFLYSMSGYTICGVCFVVRVVRFVFCLCVRLFEKKLCLTVIKFYPACCGAFLCNVRS